MNQKKTKEMSQMYSLTEHDIHGQTFASALFANTNIKAGLEECVTPYKAETEACCANKPHAGPVTGGPPSDQMYSCYVDSGTGDWD